MSNCGKARGALPATGPYFAPGDMRLARDRDLALETMVRFPPSVGGFATSAFARSWGGFGGAAGLGGAITLVKLALGSAFETCSRFSSFRNGSGLGGWSSKPPRAMASNCEHGAR